MSKKLYKIFSVIALCFFSLNANADQNLELKNWQTSLKLGVSSEVIGFDTPAANSILEWNSDTIDIGLDLKFNVSDKIFSELEYSYRKIKGGSSIDDDITNGYGFYSSHGVDGRTNDYKLNFGYKVYDPGMLSLFITTGGFYKDAKVTSTDGVANYEYSFEGYSNQTNSKYYGAMLGLKLESKTTNTKSFLQTDFLIPLRYKGDQIWYKRVPVLHWSLRNNKNISGDYGFRIKAEHGYKIKNSFIKYVKLYTYYEEIEFDGLTESEPDWIVKGGSPDSIVEGNAQYKSFGAGIALEF